MHRCAATCLRRNAPPAVRTRRCVLAADFAQRCGCPFWVSTPLPRMPAVQYTALAHTVFWTTICGTWVLSLFSSPFVCGPPHAIIARWLPRATFADFRTKFSPTRRFCSRAVPFPPLPRALPACTHGFARLCSYTRCCNVPALDHAPASFALRARTLRLRQTRALPHACRYLRRARSFLLHNRASAFCCLVPCAVTCRHLSALPTSAYFCAPLQRTYHHCAAFTAMRFTCCACLPRRAALPVRACQHSFRIWCRCRIRARCVFFASRRCRFMALLLAACRAASPRASAFGHLPPP